MFYAASASLSSLTIALARTLKWSPSSLPQDKLRCAFYATEVSLDQPFLFKCLHCGNFPEVMIMDGNAKTLHRCSARLINKAVPERFDGRVEPNKAFSHVLVDNLAKSLNGEDGLAAN